MPFGLRNAPATFHRAADIILSECELQYALVYLDYVIVYYKSRREHLDHLRTMLTLLKEAAASLKLKKCWFFEDAVDYLGHVLRPGKLEVASGNLQALEKAGLPRD